MFIFLKRSIVLVSGLQQRYHTGIRVKTFQIITNPAHKQSTRYPAHMDSLHAKYMQA